LKKLLILCAFLTSCAHISSYKGDPDFCTKAHELFTDKMAELHKGLLNEPNVNNVIFSNTQMSCEGNKAYGGWTTVLEMQDGIERVCVAFNNIVSFTDHPTEVLYKLLYVGEGELIECLTAS
jgi:hypothetical protein